MPKLKKKGYSTARKVITGLIPTEWDDLLWDAAEFVLEQMNEAAEDSENASKEVEINNSEETNYTNNYYIKNNYQSLSQNNVLNSYRRPVFNQIAPVYRISPPPLIPPPSILPTDIDNQTNTKTPIGSSISILGSSVLGKYTYGVTKFHPESTQKKAIKRDVVFDGMVDKFTQAQKDAVESIEKRKDGQPIPIEHTGFLVTTENANGLRGNGHILYGINSISLLAQFYRASSSMAFLEPTNEIPAEYKIINVNNKFEDLKFTGEATNAFKERIWEKLGYEEEEFNDKSIEDIIKDFGEKQFNYEKNLLQKVSPLNPIIMALYASKGLPVPDGIACIDSLEIENMEQFGVHALASLFFRNGFHRFPAIVPDSLIKKDLFPPPFSGIAPPNIAIDDNLEMQEYLIKNIDALIGQFPIKFKVKKEDDKGKPEEKEVTFPNISEALTEIIGSLIGVAEDSDTAVALGVKNLVEVAKCSNLALTAVDTARANADYLGYKAKEIERTIMLPFNPNGKNLNDFLTETEIKITTFDNVDESTLQEPLKMLLVASQITKAALGQKKEFITGDAIIKRRAEEKTKYDEDWKELLKKYDNTTSTSKIKTILKPFPNAKIKDKSINTTPPT